MITAVDDIQSIASVSKVSVVGPIKTDKPIS
jgi:hypothetical protein